MSVFKERRLFALSNFTRKLQSASSVISISNSAVKITFLPFHGSNFGVGSHVKRIRVHSTETYVCWPDEGKREWGCILERHKLLLPLLPTLLQLHSTAPTTPNWYHSTSHTKAIHNYQTWRDTMSFWDQTFSYRLIDSIKDKWYIFFLIF